MSRRHRAVKRTPPVDPVYKNITLGRFTNLVMSRGKKSTAEKIMYSALDELAEKTKQPPLEVFEKALANARPALELKSRRVGGATYQVPIEVKDSRGEALAMRWIIDNARRRKGQSMARALANELLDAYNNTGSAIKKRDDTHKMAQANRAFAHYRW